VVWVFGPPGAGKTTLLASYVESRALRGLWYQVDAGDADPATFFYYLREAAPRRARSPLPLLTPEYLPDLAGFTRRFFRALFQRLQAPAVWVLDNFQEAPESSPFRGIVRDAAAELPAGINLVVVSRAEPPAEYARLNASGALALLGADELRLTVPETEGIVGLQLGKGLAGEAHALHERAGGWAAGLTLLLRGGGPAAGSLPDSSGGPQAVFDYLATEVFQQASPEMRALWLRTALLPRFTADAAQRLSGNDKAERLLDQLCRWRYFIDRRRADDPSYEYHALFQEFLRHQLRDHYSAAERERLAHRSAQELEKQGETDAALALYRDAGDWEAASELILRQAPALFALGRVQTLEAWINRLAPATIEQTPWLLFWLGTCRTQTGGPAGGRRVLERAYAAFAAARDAPGQALAAAAMIDTFFIDWSDFAQIDPWIDKLETLLAREPAFPSSGSELHVRASLLMALVHCHPQRPQARLCAERIWQLRSAEIGNGEKLMAATALLYYRVNFGSSEQASATAAAFAPLAASPDTTPMQRIAWTWPCTFFHGSITAFDDVQRVSREAQELAVANGLAFALDFLRLSALWGTLPDNVDTAARVLDELGTGIGRGGPNDVALYHFMSAWLALLQQRPRQALDHGEKALNLTRTMGGLCPLLCSLGVCAEALAECGELDRALEVAREASARVVSLSAGMVRFTVLLVEADVLLRTGRHDEFLKTLGEALATGRRGGHRNTIFWLPRMMSRLCAAALEAGIETEYVEQLIRARGVAPERPDIERWPWPVRIYTLGRLSVVIDGQPLVFEGKAQRKPLELLAAVVAQGSRGVDSAALTAQLWPDQEGDASRNALGQAVHRLRKLLIYEETLRMQGGKLHLDDDRVWTDTRAFERLCAEVEREAAQPGAKDALAAGQRLLRLYPGHFMKGEEAPWAIAARERMRSKFVRAVSALGRRLEGDGAGEARISLYRRAIELDPLIEEFHRALIAAYRSLGRTAEALDAYRRCRDILSVTLGIAPNAETQALYRSLKP